jgi:hypothetical protein
MKSLRVAVTVVLILVWGMFVPAAMAADHCAMMNFMCEGPCGASSPASAPTVPAFIGLVSRAPLAAPPAVPEFERAALEPPPKPLVPFA